MTEGSAKRAPGSNCVVFRTKFFGYQISQFRMALIYVRHLFFEENSVNMGLQDKSSNHLTCAFTSLAMLCCACVLLSCIGFVRVEFKLGQQEKKIVALENEVQMWRKLKEADDHMSRRGLYRREIVPPPSPSPSKDRNICHQCVKPWIREEIVSSVSYAVEAFCHPNTKLCIRGPPGPPGAPGPKGEPGTNRNPSIKSDDRKPDLGTGELNLLKEERTGSINAPGIRVDPSLLTVNEHSHATFTCSSTNAGRARIVWERVGGFPKRRKLIKLKGGKLKLTNVERKDEGSYMCTVESPSGLSRAVVTLKVRSKPRIYIGKGPIYAVKGDNVTLPRCRATGFPKPVVSWLKVLDRMPEGRTVTSLQTMTLLKVRRSDSGIYLCTATNALGRDRAITYLVVLVRPRFTIRPPRKIRAYAGSTLVVNCTANANPKPLITWEKCGTAPLDDRFVAVSNGKLRIDYVKSSDSGMYACVASSRPLVSKAPFELKVKIARDCWVLYESGVRTNGVYKINPDNKGPFDVYCDMTTDGGGWTVFQRRYDGSINFFRRWKEYKAGFGKLTGEFWLGNTLLHRLTRAKSSELRIDMEDWEGNRAYAKYGSFSIGDEKASYRLDIDLYTGTAGDSLSYSNGMAFTTLDRDNDINKQDNCAMTSIGAWWYKSCHDSNLNGQFVQSSRNPQGMLWYFWKNDESTIKGSQMKLRPKKTS